MLTSHSSLISRIEELAKFPTKAEKDRILSGLNWIGVLSSEKAPIVEGNLLDTLCRQLQNLMSFKEGERDLVMLQHKFVVEWPDRPMVWRRLTHLAEVVTHKIYRRPRHPHWSCSVTRNASLEWRFRLV